MRDVTIPVRVGQGGLNLRDAALEVSPEELTDGLNFRLDERGALIKRTGFTTYGAAILAAAVKELWSYLPSNGSYQLVAYLGNGDVRTSTLEAGTWTTRASALSVARQPSSVQYLDTLYVGNGTDALQTWDGTTWATVAAAPKGALLAVWRNRLWIAGDPLQPRRLYWSDLGNPASWVNVATNYVDLPGYGPITALAPSPSADAQGTSPSSGDRLLVFRERATNAVYDSSDNVAGVTSGGANVLIDPQMGAVNQRSIAAVRGRLFLLGRLGVYSTDGTDPLRLETSKLGSFFFDSLSPSAYAGACAAAYRGNYLLAITPSGAGTNTLLLELYTSLPRDNTGQLAIHAADVAVQAMTRYPSSAGERLYFSNENGYVRLLGTVGYDTTGLSTQRAITAYARTGAMTFGTTNFKRLRRIRVDGRGIVNVGIVSDLKTAIAESHPFDMSSGGDALWNGGWLWNDGTLWGPSGPAVERVQWYDRKARWFQLHFAESGSSTLSATTRLGVAGPARGGAAIYAVELRVTPLEC